MSRARHQHGGGYERCLCRVRGNVRDVRDQGDARARQGVQQNVVVNFRADFIPHEEQGAAQALREGRHVRISLSAIAASRQHPFSWISVR
jgi:hypothetical protein